jgi:hypothetical protein
MTSARDTYASSVKTAETQLSTTGLAGNGAAAPSFDNNTQQYPSLQAIEAAYALGQITATQRTAYKLATEMACQVAIRTARDTLVNTGDVGPV